MQSPLTLYHMWPCQALSLRPGRLHGLCRSITDSKWAWKHQGFHPAPLTCHVHGQGYVERAFRDPPPRPRSTLRPTIFPRGPADTPQHGPTEFCSCNKDSKATSLSLCDAQTTSAGKTWFCWRKLVSLAASEGTDSKGSCLPHHWLSSCFWSHSASPWGLPRGRWKVANDSLITLDCPT